MPELPEVETVVRGLRSNHLLESAIESVEVFWERSVTGVTPAEFAHRLEGAKILDICRRGKYIRLSLSSGYLFIHLRMTGQLQFRSPVAEPFPYERVVFHLSDGRNLCFLDMRKFGRCAFVHDPHVIEGALGIEPLSPEFTWERLKGMLKERSRALKPLLFDQSLIAGLGNIYIDEALWQARLHPLRSPDSFSDEEFQALHQAIVTVLEQGVSSQGTSLGSHRAANYFSVGRRPGSHMQYLKVFRRHGLPCPRCGTTIQKSRIGQRGTHFCPLCQRC